MISCFFNDTATTEIYTYVHTLSLHDALPIAPSLRADRACAPVLQQMASPFAGAIDFYAALREAKVPAQISLYPGETTATDRSEEHTSELQSLMRISYAVFCLKKIIHTISHISTTIYNI